jgi:hypothetical protein
VPLGPPGAGDHRAPGAGTASAASGARGPRPPGRGRRPGAGHRPDSGNQHCPGHRQSPGAGVQGDRLGVADGGVEPALQAGHAGSIPVTRSTRFRRSRHLLALLEKVWRTVRKTRFRPLETPVFRSVGHELVTAPYRQVAALARPSRGLPVTTTGHAVSSRPYPEAIRRTISSTGTARRSAAARL